MRYSDLSLKASLILRKSEEGLQGNKLKGRFCDSRSWRCGLEMGLDVNIQSQAGSSDSYL
ncbi:hypothetical protein AAY473_032693 [Plecturocebus cupreus]